MDEHHMNDRARHPAGDYFYLMNTTYTREEQSEWIFDRQSAPLSRAAR